jgi:hypothetical protein
MRIAALGSSGRHSLALSSAVSVSNVSGLSRLMNFCLRIVRCA